MNIERDIEIAERVTSLEVKEEELRKDVDSVKTDVSSMKNDMSKLVSEVKQIRNALYFMGAMIAANVPVFQIPFKLITVFLGF